MNFFSKNQIANFCIFLYFVSIVLLYIIGNNIFAALPFLLILILLFVSFSKLNMFFIYTYFFFSILILFNHFFWDMKFYPQWYFFTCSIIIGYFMNKVKLEAKFSILIFMMSFFYFAYNIFNGRNLNTDVFEYNSRNFISIILITLSMYVYFSEIKSKTIKNIIFILSFIICCLSFGRTGIFVSLLILFVYQFEVKNFKVTILMTVLILFITLYYWTDIGDLLKYSVDRFENNGLVDSHRSAVLGCYYNQFEFGNIFLGLNAYGNSFCGALATGSYSPHNSLIYLTTNSGVISLVIFVPVFLGMIKKETRLVSLLISIFVIRSLTDNMLFYTFLDVIYWCFYFKIYDNYIRLKR